MTIPAYPLQWPDGWKRTSAAQRTTARFSVETTTQYKRYDGTYANSRGKRELTIADAVARVREQLAKMRVADDFVISSNLRLKLDGLPASGQREPDDPGVAVYWSDGRDTRAMAIDRYDRTADNLAAIAATLAAMRAIERHGGAEILNRAFTGFTALEDQSRPWHTVLGVQAHTPTEQVRDAYKRARAAAHPDHGGNAELFQAIQAAWSAFCKERGMES